MMRTVKDFVYYTILFTIGFTIGFLTFGGADRLIHFNGGS